jgi:hypothetical protein
MRVLGVALVAVLHVSSVAQPVLPGKFRGVCWEAAGPVDAARLAPLAELGADWISQTPFGWCPSRDDPEVRIAAGSRVMWGESDAGLAETARLARAAGIRTLLKPHLWVHGAWVGEIRMRSEDDWQRWFHAYEEFILHYAQLAEREGMDGLAVGTELCATTGRSQDWRRLIARVRQAYHGPLTYCANWHEAEAVEFWDAVDFVGVQAYYPLAAGERPSVGALRDAWQPISARLEALSRRTGRRVVFTEAGYKSLGGSLAEPWRWDLDGATDYEVQRNAYQALFESLWDRPWFGGLFVWKWHSRLGAGMRPAGRFERDFTPQGKPALGVIRERYRAGR